MSMVPKPEGPRNEIIFGPPYVNLRKLGSLATDFKFLTEDNIAEIYEIVLRHPGQGGEGVVLRDLTERIEFVARERILELTGVVL